jgi:integral membrane protein
MKKFFNSSVGRLRLIAGMEGTSLLLLVFIGMPLKHFGDNESMVKIMGPIHGALFLLFVFNALRVAVEQRWKFSTITWKLLVASLLPFGTLYIDYTILRRFHAKELSAEK